MMNNKLKKELAAITYQQWTVLLFLLSLVNVVVLGGLLWLLATQSPGGFQQVFAQAPATRTPLPTFTASPTGRPPATPINTFVPTWTPTITPTPVPTETPIPPTPVRRVARAQPTPTGTATPTPTPAYDYVGAIRQMTPCENEGKHHIFAYVRDKAGNGIPGVRMRVFWPGGVGGEAILVTGTKIQDAGLADFAMFKGSYFIEVLDGVSQVIGPISPDIPQDEVCPTSGNTVGNSLFHYSFEVIFTKTR
jgi:hypothetical protein